MLRNIQRRDIRNAIANAVFSKPILAINAGGAATVKTTNAIDFSVGGIMYSKAALSAQALAADATGQEKISGQTGFHTQQANTTAYLLLVIDAAGNVKCLQGLANGQSQVVVGSATFDLNYFKVPKGDGSIPDPNVGQTTEKYTAFGLIKVATGATTFLPGTDALDKASVTFTFYDLQQVPVAAP